MLANEREGRKKTYRARSASTNFRPTLPRSSQGRYLRVFCDNPKRLASIGNSHQHDASPATHSAAVPLDSDKFDYSLPEHLVAQVPSEKRDRSRLLVVDRSSHRITHRTFADLPEFLRPEDVLFRNNAAVLPARLCGKRPSGGQAECLLLRPLRKTEPPGKSAGEVWLCLLRPARRLYPGAKFSDPSGAFEAEIVARFDEGMAEVSFSIPDGRTLAEVAVEVGEIPLPPYVKRLGSRTERTFDMERYQTVYANRARRVAAAAPTAGLHFTPELLLQLEKMGVRMRELTLHVGLGTFRPIQTATVEEHTMHKEVYEIPVAAQRALFPQGPGRRIAVGTTSVRACEDFLARHDAPLDKDYVGEADIFIYPPRTFRGIDALITNFHQPNSTLLCMVAAFLTPGAREGIAWLQEIYREAIAREYRFFSYGDAMLIL